MAVSEAAAIVNRNFETLRDDVRVSEIFWDDFYGRPLRPQHEDDLFRNWDRAKVGAIYLSLRPDGRFACLDGWHRVCACRHAEGDDATLPARVYIDLTREQEADLFVAFNKDRKKLKPGELFHARLARGEIEAREINQIVQRLGMAVSIDGRPGDGIIQSVKALEHVYEQYGGNSLRKTLQLLRDSMGMDAGAVRGQIIEGLAAFLMRYSAVIDEDRLLAVLSTHSAAQLYGEAHALQALSPTTAMRTACGQAIQKLYNHRLRTKHLPPWQSKGIMSEQGKESVRQNLAKINASRSNGAR